MIIEWRGIKVDVIVKNDIMYLEEALNTLMLPYTLLKSGASAIDMIDCCESREISVGPLRLAVCFDDWCSTSGCYAQVRVCMPRDHPLYPLVKKAVEKTWLDSVREVAVRAPDEVVYIEVSSWKVRPETIEVKCQDGNRVSIFQTPLSIFKKNLEAVLDKSQVLKIFEKAKKIVEEVERRFKSEQDKEEVDVEFLEKRLRKSYLSYFSFDNELDVEF